MVDAAVDPMVTGQLFDASVPPATDAAAPADGGAVAVVDAGPAAASDEPPAIKDGKRLYAVRFDLRAGDAPFGCGKPAKLGVAETMAQPSDARLYVHDVALTRANGERVLLELHQDGRYQRDNVALIDFVDDTGNCFTGDKDLRTVVYGYAPEQADYTGVAFDVGIPADKNHLDGAIAPAPYNVTGMWWSWLGGYKYMKFDLVTPSHPQWYFHAGAVGCSGMSASGYACSSLQLGRIALQGFDVNSSLVVLDVEKLYANSDLSASPDSLSGCMGGKTDLECAPLYNALGVVPWDDVAARPEQTAFEIRPGMAWQPSQTSRETKRRSITDPTVWPDPTYQRNPALDKVNVSRADGDASHAPGDPRYGANCQRCHQANGPGIGQFTAAGTVFDAMGKPAQGAKVEIVAGTADRPNNTLIDVTRYALLEVDKNGNFFTTEPIPYAEQKLTARILGANDQVLATMFSSKQTGACNTCHTASFRLELPLPMGP